MGGTLKRGWTAQTEKDAENGNSKRCKRMGRFIKY